MEYVFSDVNEALPVMMERMMDTSDKLVFERGSRNGPVFESFRPVTTIYEFPTNRVLFDPARDANPFFHVFEAIWMLAGWNDVAWVAKFNKQMMEYSDDGKTIAGSNYGERWQRPLSLVYRDLVKNKDSRRAFIPIFVPEDNERQWTSKDLPCNTGVHFLVRLGYQLDMTVFNRSNDMLLGAYGANYVHFGFLQEYLACALGLAVGEYSQISSCFHLYKDFPVTKRILEHGLTKTNRYETDPRIQKFVKVLNGSVDDWQGDAWQLRSQYAPGDFCETGPFEWKEKFFREVAAPMYLTWHRMIKQRNFQGAMNASHTILADDWRIASQEWIQRRQAERDRRASGG